MMRRITLRRQHRGFIESLPVNTIGRQVFVLRHWLPLANQRYTERPELAGVGIAADVLDAVTWGA